MPVPSDAAAAQTLRLVGLAFAGADLVFEIDMDGKVTFALGAGERLTGHADATLVGRPWSDLVAEGDADLLAALLAGLKPGERQGPLRVSLPPKGKARLTRHASLSIFHLPQLNHRLSCALSLGAPAGADQTPAAPGGFMAQDAFATAAAQLLDEASRAGLPLSLDLVEMTGLEANFEGLAPPAAAEAKRRFAAALRAESYAGLGAAEVARDRYALVRAGDASSARMSERLSAAVDGAVTPNAVQLQLSGASAGQNIRAMRYALDRYIEDGPEAAGQGFMATVERTVRDTTRFKAMLASSDFHLAYQPVVVLTDERLHHFEALARFDANSSPADTIRLAEELEMITEFDLAVAQGVVKALVAADKDVRIAANLSGHSLANPKFVDDLLALTAHAPGLRPRMLLELTETRALEDLDQANIALARLRKAGHIVCLDDFGAGAASLDYVRKLEVDIVKIDGRYIQGLEAGSRDAIVVKHVVALCTELGITTIAEMIETPKVARTCRELGVTLGQGWTFAKPLSEPKWRSPLADAPPVARRAGVREEWG